MLTLVSGATSTVRSADVGHLIMPRQWFKHGAKVQCRQRRWAMDNGGYGGLFDAGAFVTMLKEFADVPGCLFVTAPDVIYASGIGDAAATLKEWPFWSRLIRGLGFAPAFVVQDGQHAEDVPWDEIGALFIGGSSAMKESILVRGLCGYASARGIWVHWGRVNGKRRYEMAKMAGADSIDGTGFSMYPDTNIPKIAEWESAIAAQPQLDLAR